MNTSVESQSALTQYQNFVPTTAIYPLYSDRLDFPHRQNPFYCGMGLVGEAREFEESVGDFDQSPEQVGKELSDALWYAIMLACEMGWEIGDLLLHGQDLLNSTDYSQGLYAIAGGVLEPLKKLWRDGHSDKQMVALRDALAAIIACIDEQAMMVGADGIEDIASISQARLTRRKSEGKLHGSGSDRRPLRETKITLRDFFEQKS